jgi:hypothetical protein
MLLAPADPPLASARHASKLSVNNRRPLQEHPRPDSPFLATGVEGFEMQGSEKPAQDMDSTLLIRRAINEGFSGFVETCDRFLRTL